MTTYRPRARLLALIALLAALSGMLFIIPSLLQQGRKSDRPSLLVTKIDEPAFRPDATPASLRELAERTAAELVRDYPRDPKAWSVQARRHFLLNETEEAVGVWRDCLEMDADFADAYFGLGLVALDRGQHEDAIERFQDVARLGGDDPRVPVLLAKSLLHGGRAEDAILTLEQHVATERTSAEAWEMLGQAHLQTQNFSRAAECFEVAVQALPDMKDAVYGLSRAHAALGHAQQADAYAEQFRQLAEKAHVESTEDAKAFQDRQLAARVAAQTFSDAARVRGDHGETKRAEGFLLRAVLLQPANAQFLVQLQRSLQRRGAHPEAAEIGERIVELEPRQIEHWLNLGWVYSHLNRPDEAIAACQRAIKLNPDDPRCRQAYEIIQRAE